MAVHRTIVTTECSEGHFTSILTEPLSAGSEEFDLFSTNNDTVPRYSVCLDTRNQKDKTIRAWAAGNRVCQILTQVGLSHQITPVIIRLTTENNASSLIEGAVDPIIISDQRSQVVQLFYWVNAWSPKPFAVNQDLDDPLEDPSLPKWSGFPDPYAATPELINFDIVEPLPPSGCFTAIRDVPDWTLDTVAPFNPNCFWVAPVGSQFPYRLSEDFPPILPDGTSSPPLPPSVPLDESNDAFLANFDTYMTPKTETLKVLYKAKDKINNGDKLSLIERATVDEYTKDPSRSIGLNRTTRVLMWAQGRLEGLRRQPRDDNPVSDGASLPPPKNKRSGIQTYLVLDPPKPIWWAPAASNRVLAARQKWTSYLPDGRIFVTAPLDYRYPVAASLSLVSHVPQIDESLFDPPLDFSSLLSGGILPEAQNGSDAPSIPEATLFFPSGFPTSLVAVLSTLDSWAVY